MLAGEYFREPGIWRSVVQHDVPPAEFEKRSARGCRVFEILVPRAVGFNNRGVYSVRVRLFFFCFLLEETLS